MFDRLTAGETLAFFADESKINSMLSETDRNREMCNQIVRRVFTDPVQTSADQLLCPVGRLVSSTISRVHDQSTFHLRVKSNQTITLGLGLV